MKRSFLILALLLLAAVAGAQDTASASREKSAHPVVHPAMGTKMMKPGVTVELVGRKQNYAPHIKETAEKDINSPKSVNIHPSGEKYYVNSLEGGTTLVFDFQSGEKLKTMLASF